MTVLSESLGALEKTLEPRQVTLRGSIDAQKGRVCRAYAHEAMPESSVVADSVYSADRGPPQDRGASR